MTAVARKLAYSVLLLSLIAIGWAQRRHDPLTPLEGDELRDAAQEPDTRIKLYLQFVRARLVTLEQMRADPKVTDRGQQTHDKLQNFLEVYDELNDNIDTFVGRRADLRKAVKLVIDADTEFQAKLRALQSSAEATPAEVEQYRFLLGNALEAVDGGLQDHKQLLAEQEEAAKRKKK